MARKKLILIPSEKMDSNKKEGRNEHGLIRMSKVARTSMGFSNSVEVYPETSDTGKRLNNSILLDIFHAFSEDIKKARAAGTSEDDLKRTGFVTTKMYNRITGGGKGPTNIWITDDVNDTVIGADPEFLLFEEAGKIVRANNVLGYQGPIGCDGAMAEVRPKPAIRPEELVENIRVLFASDKLVAPIKNYNWMAGCYFKDDQRDYPIGGHIHIGNPVRIAKMDTDRRTDFFKAFNKIIDELLAIPMTKIDGTELGRARRTQCKMGKYGYFGEFRTCNGRLEHRTLSGMWLMHPQLTLLVFGTAKAIIDEVYRHVAHNDYKMDYMFPAKFRSTNVWNHGFTGWKDIPLVNDIGCVASSEEMIKSLNESAISKISTKFLSSWYSRMKKLSTYKTYSKYIDGLYEILKIKASEFQDYDKKIQKNWLEGAKFLN